MVSAISTLPILMSNLCSKASVNKKEEKVKVIKPPSIETALLRALNHLFVSITNNMYNIIAI